MFYQGKEVELEAGVKFYIKEDERMEYKGEFLVYPADENSIIHPRFVSKLLKKRGSEHPSSIFDHHLVLSLINRFWGFVAFTKYRYLARNPIIEVHHK